MKLADVRETLQRNIADTTRFLGHFHVTERLDSWLQILLDCNEFAVEQRRAGVRQDYMEAYAGITAMSFTNAETARCLLFQGLYGNCLGLIRILTVQNDLIQDLSVTPQSAGRWLALRQITPADRSKRAEKLRSFFKDSSVRNRLTRTGQQPLSQRIYGVASEAVHGTPWASHLFSSESLSEPGLIYLEYSPQYHPVRALSLAIVLQACLPHLSGFFMETCHSDYWKKDDKFDRLAARYRILLDAYELESPKLDALVRAVDRAQERLVAGEDFDSVFPGDQELSAVNSERRL